MKIDFTYDPTVSAWILTHEDVRLQSLSDVREWEQLARQTMGQMTEPGYVLVDLTGFSLAPEMGPEFGALTKNFTMPRTKGIIRYGRVDEMTRRVIQLQATVNRFPAHLEPDRAAALVLLERLRKGAA